MGLLRTLLHSRMTSAELDVYVHENRIFTSEEGNTEYTEICGNPAIIFKRLEINGDSVRETGMELFLYTKEGLLKERQLYNEGSYMSPKRRVHPFHGWPFWHALPGAA